MNLKDEKMAAKKTALLSITEIGLGSLLHSWRIPFSGHFLSLNQGWVLCRASRESSSKEYSLPFKISFVASLLKSLSPAGKRLTPMLAISIQGLLFSIGQFFFGTGYLGCLSGMILLSLWAFVQPIALYLIIFGKDILEVGKYFLRKIQPVVHIESNDLIFVFSLLVFLKLFLAMAVSSVYFFDSSTKNSSYEKRVKRFYTPPPLATNATSITWTQRILLILKDMRKPWFLISISFMLAYFFLTPKTASSFWAFVLRPLATAFLIFYSLRFLPIEKWLNSAFPDKKSEIQKILRRSLALIKSGEKTV